MNENPIAKAALRLATGCSFALLIALGDGATFAHGGGNHGGGNHNGNGSQDHRINFGKWSDKGIDDYRHHKKTASHGPLHGPGSSHNPIIDHPVHGPGSSHNPIVVKKPRNGLPPGTVVRDHRNGRNCWYVIGEDGSRSTPTCTRRLPPQLPLPYCNQSITYHCIPVRDHRGS